MYYSSNCHPPTKPDCSKSQILHKNPTLTIQDTVLIINRNKSGNCILLTVTPSCCSHKWKINSLSFLEVASILVSFLIPTQCTSLHTGFYFIIFYLYPYFCCITTFQPIFSSAFFKCRLHQLPKIFQNAIQMIIFKNVSSKS